MSKKLFQKGGEGADRELECLQTDSVVCDKCFLGGTCAREEDEEAEA